ncbi:hypothetical protein B0I32_115100 [Nonomuraea fuscirosea]|uniref:Uncharacterized protein n=1 Tax=Nonomuraea fuscirosea TaxID=1291556 RepID=A0A2T0MRX4_9ACTN|nr:hypothetical protein B0I32_115100 [Nonomuraea fuscirosea]
MIWDPAAEDRPGGGGRMIRVLIAEDRPVGVSG